VARCAWLATRVQSASGPAARYLVAAPETPAVDLRRGQSALRIVLSDGSPYDELLVSTPDANGLLQLLREAGVGRHSRQAVE
jgi:hypothetical protein